MLTAALLIICTTTFGFTPITITKTRAPAPFTSTSLASKQHGTNPIIPILLGVTLSLSPLLPAEAASTSPEANYVKNLQTSIRDASSSKSSSQLYKAFESIRDTIQDGTGVGGQVDVSGNSVVGGGFTVSQGEDKTRYDSGLVLLTEKEKRGLVEGE